MRFPTALIGDFTKIRTGKLDANAATSDGKYPFFTCAQAPLSIDRYAYDCDAILVAGNGDLNVKHYKGKFEAYQRTYIIEVANESKLDSRYLYFFMSKYVEKLRELSIGGVIKYIKLGMLTDAEIPLPPLAEQKRIAAILDKADAIRRKRQAAIKLADDFLRATFLDMFGDPVMNPRGWDINTLEDVCEKITDGTHHSPPITQTGIPYITAKHLKKGCLDFYAKPWFVSEKDHKAIYNRCDPRPGDVLYIKDGATTGRAAINEYAFEFSMLSSLALIRAKKGLLTSAYLCDWLNNERTKTKLLGGVAGAAITRFTIKKIKDFRIELPPVGLQEKYNQIRKKVMLSMGNQKRAKALADMEFNSLSQKAFRGELGKNGRCSAS